VDVCLDVVVQEAALGGLDLVGEFARVEALDERVEVETGRGTHGSGLEDGVGEAERGAVEDVLGKPQVRRAESWGSPDRAAAVVERAVLRPLRDRCVVVGVPEHALLPAPPCAATVRGETTVAGAGLEL